MIHREPHLPSYGRLAQDFVDGIAPRHVALLILVVLAIAIFTAA